jgi:hypothetical protein
MKHTLSLLTLLACLAFAMMFTSAQEATPESTPEATAEATAEATPEVTPEATPDVDDDNDGVIIVIEGPVQAININIIIIYNINIVVAPSNPILTLIAVGDIIRVEGELDDDGTVIATNVTNFLNNGVSTVLIEGAVQAINANIVVINNINIQLASDDPILTTLKIGDFLSVDGNFSDDDGDGTFVLVVVTVIIINFDADDGGGNGNNDDGEKRCGNNGRGNGRGDENCRKNKDKDKDDDDDDD